MPLRLILIAALLAIGTFSRPLFAAPLPAPLPAPAEIEAGARQFYETRGEWAGKFVIRTFMRSRIETLSETVFIAHLEYQWAFGQDTSHSGTDERTFEFQFQDGKWQVIRMGGNHSGRL